MKLLIHGARLWWLDRRLRRDAAARAVGVEP